MCACVCVICVICICVCETQRDRQRERETARTHTHTNTHAYTHTHTRGVQESELNNTHVASVQQLKAQAESKMKQALDKQGAEMVQQHNQEMENKVVLV